MKILLDAVTLFTLGSLLIVIATLTLRWPFANMSEGELRCESGGAVVVKIAGQGYAVNGMASTPFRRYSKFGTTPMIRAPISIA
jgi:hypothetical protein